MSDIDETNEIKWIPATNKMQCQSWMHFLRSEHQIGNQRRYHAKCKYCFKVMIGKPERMKKHLLSSCDKIDGETRGALMSHMNGVTAANKINKSSDKEDTISTVSPNTNSTSLATTTIKQHFDRLLLSKEYVE